MRPAGAAAGKCERGARGDGVLHADEDGNDDYHDGALALLIIGPGGGRVRVYQPLPGPACALGTPPEPSYARARAPWLPPLEPLDVHAEANAEVSADAGADADGLVRVCAALLACRACEREAAG